MKTTTTSVQIWETIEISGEGPDLPGSWMKPILQATFQCRHRRLKIDGFYDGNGTYRIRFMPDGAGVWTWETVSGIPELNGHEGSFEVLPALADNHGPVRVRQPYDLVYADGSWFSNIGTTCYAWVHQPDSLYEKTLQTLAESPFNKLRFCLFPKHYRYNENEPPVYPFRLLQPGDSKWLGSHQGEQERGWSFDWTVIEPGFFQRMDRALQDLLRLGIEADLILFHPYDRWGFSHLPAATEDALLRYVCTRFSAYRNVWWSFANEWDLMPQKTENDWERYARVVEESDPFGHLRSIHNCRRNYDHGRPWVTHVSFQGDPAQVKELREKYHKPVVVDECRYEGNIEEGWGNISGENLTSRFWTAIAQGGYCGHGETYWNDQEILWWSKGGSLGGTSPARLEFLRTLVERNGGGVFMPTREWHWRRRGENDREFLYWGGDQQAREISFQLPEGAVYRGHIIDTWQMTLTELPEPLSGKILIPLPSRTNMAVWLEKVS